MKLTKTFLIFTALLLSLNLFIACGGDDGDDDSNTGDENDTSSGDEDTGDENESGDDPIASLMAQAGQGCTQYWDTTCEFDWTDTDFADTDAFCAGWVDAYKPTMEQFAEGMNMECMQQVMGGFFECMADSCDIEDKWSSCNGEVQANMMGCFED